MVEPKHEKAVGVVRDYFRKVQVAAIEVTAGMIRVGDTLRFHGAHTDFAQKVESMQINRQPIVEAKAGDEVGILIGERVREGDLVFLEGGKVEEML